jgi:hypothetical protein
MNDWWHTKQWRLIQTNLREIDMRDIKATQVVTDLQSFQANVLMINAAGIIASYPTKLPFHYQSPYLTGDSLHDILDACHAAGIRVFARTDFSKVRRPIYENHPDWAYISLKGQIVDYNGDVHVCINGPYQQIYALRIIEELLNTHDFDGIFFNMGGYQTRDYSGNYYGICHCQHCQHRFSEMFNLDLPQREDLEDPVYRKYSQFKQVTLSEHHKKVYNYIMENWPHVCIANHTQFNRGFIRQESNTAVGRPLPHWQYSASDNTKWAVTSFPDMVSSNTTVDFIDFPYRHVTVSPYQQSLRLVQNLANGGAVDYYLIGRLDNHEDRSGYQGIQDIYHFHAKYENVYTHNHSMAHILMLKAGENVQEYRGWYRVLTEGHFLFDVVRLDAAIQIAWDRYETIIIPGVTALSDELVKHLDDFVENGGTIIAVGQSGFRYEDFSQRQQPALACLGIDKVLCIREDMRSSYFKWKDKTNLLRFDNTDLVYMDSPYVYAQYVNDTMQNMQLIPPHNYGPPERCYYALTTDFPGFVIHPFGKGKGIYIPWLPGALLHRQGHLNTIDFCLDILQCFAKVESVGGKLPPMVEVTHFESDDSAYQLIHLVNGSGHFGNSFYAPVPVKELEVRIKMSRQPRLVIGLRSGQPLSHSWIDHQLIITVPELGLFEAIKIDF